VRVDNPSFVSVEANGNSIEIRLTASSAASARATLEDLLACLRAAEKTASERAADATSG